MNLNLKDFDIKQFLLKRGEWIGLGIALAIMLPAFVMGAMNALTAGSANANASELEGLAKAANQRIDQSIPPADADKPPTASQLQVRNDRVEPVKYVPPNDWFIGSSIEDTKRRAPVVLAAGDFKVDYVPGAMMSHIYLERKDAPQILIVRETKVNPSPRDKKMMERLKNLQKKYPNLGGGMGGMFGSGGGGGKGGGSGGMGAPGMGMGMGQPGMGSGEQRGGGGFGPPGMGGGFGQRPSNTIKKLEFMDVDKVSNEQSVHFAEELRPVRMVIVTGAFPFKDQLDAFRIALRKRTLNDLINILQSDEAPFEFAGFDIERRVLHLDGTEAKPWEKHGETMWNTLKYYMARAVDYEKEDPDLGKFWGIKNKGLIWTRPVLELPYTGNDESKYPKVEIPAVKDAIAKLEKEGTENLPKVLNKFQQKLKGQFDPSNPDDPLGTDEESNKMEQEPTQKPPEDPNKKNTGADADEPAVPEKALVRFLDLTVQPGHAYEYRVRIRMKNPNYGKEKEVAYTALAKNKEIVGDWSQVPRIDIPWEANWYVMAERPDKERLDVQFQKWVDYVYADEKNKETGYSAVADWVVLDKGTGASCFRGEYVGHIDYVPTITWSVEKEDWEFARNAKRSGTRMPVDFKVKPDDKPYAALLVDYEGGKSREFRVPGKPPILDDAPVQALVLAPDGKLELRTNLQDKEDPERKKRYDEWKNRMEDMRNPNKRRNNQQMPNLFDRGSNKGGGNQ